MDDTRQQEKGGLEDDMTGEGPTQAKHRAAENDGIARAPLIRALRSRPSESCIRDSGPPPPPLRLKVERQGGSGIAFIAVDPGALIWTVGEVRPRFRTPPPPPPLKGRKAGGVRNSICAVDPGARIAAARTCSLLTMGA
jgi:hypothetical protein